MKFQQLFEYNRQKTSERLGEKLFLAAKRDANYWKWHQDKPKEQVIDGLLELLEDIDPTPNNKNVQWLAKQYIAQQFRAEDAPRVKEVLENFVQLKPALTRNGISADINRYDYHSLVATVKKILDVDVGSEEATEKSKIKRDDVKVWYDGPLGQLVTPLTKKASCDFGAGTEWCTAYTTADNYFDTYNKDGPLYIWRDRNGEKYQFWVDTKTGSDIQFMDSSDRSMFEYHWDTLDEFRHNHPILKKFFKEILEPEILQNTVLARRYGMVIPGGWDKDIRKNHPEVLGFRQLVESLGHDDDMVLERLIQIVNEAVYLKNRKSLTEYYNTRLKEPYSPRGVVLYEWNNVVQFLRDHGDTDAWRYAASVLDGNFDEYFYSFSVGQDEKENFIENLSSDAMNEFIAFVNSQDPDISLNITNSDEILTIIDQRSDIPAFDNIGSIIEQAINVGAARGLQQEQLGEFESNLDNAAGDAEGAFLVYNWDSEYHIELDQPVFLVVEPGDFVKFLDRNYPIQGEFQFLDDDEGIEPFIENLHVPFDEVRDHSTFDNSAAEEHFLQEIRDIAVVNENNIFEKYERIYRKQAKATHKPKTSKPSKTGEQPHPYRGKLVGESFQDVKVHPVSVQDHYRGESFGSKVLTVDGKIKAIAKLSILDDEVYIQNIETSEDSKRKGYAKQLVDDLFREFPDKTISVSMMTDSGSAFFRSQYNVDDETGELIQKVSENFADGKSRAKQATNEAINPHGDAEKHLELMMQGRKPAALIHQEEYERYFQPYVDRYQWNVVKFEKPMPTYQYVGYVISQQGDRARAERIAQLVKSTDLDDIDQDYHIELGHLLGYSEQDIRDFLVVTGEITENSADGEKNQSVGDIPQEIYDLLRELTPDDVGSEDFGDYVLRFEGFTDWCQQDAMERCQLPDDHPLKLKYYEAVYDEVLDDWIHDQGSKPIDTGFAGSDDYPIQWAIFKKQHIEENFADGKVKGKSRPGRAKRAGVDCSKSVSALRKTAKNSSGEKQKMAHWCANMKAGRKKKK
jgi:hypothetical protein